MSQSTSHTWSSTAPHYKTKTPAETANGGNVSKISLIGQGGFGCVYYRGFDSRGNLLNKRYVTKITKLEKTREIDIGKIISKIPGYDSFFATVISVDPIDLAVLKPGTIDSCEMISRHIRKSETRSEEAKFQVLKEAYVPNVSMLELVEQRGGKNQSQLTAAKMLNTLICCHDHLLVALSRMQSETQVVHYDLKAGNVVFNTRSRNPIIIDFGLSFLIHDVRSALRKTDDGEAIDALRQLFYGFFPDYAPWPIEVHIICYIINATIELKNGNNSKRRGSKGGSSAGADETDRSDTDTTNKKDGTVIATLTREALSDLLTEYIQAHQFVAEQSTAYKNAFYDRAMRIYTRTAVGRPGMEVIRDYVADWKMWDYYSIETMFLDLLEVMRKAYTAAELAPFMSQYDAFSTALQRAGNYID